MPNRYNSCCCGARKQEHSQYCIKCKGLKMRKSAIERLMSKVIRNAKTECWEFCGSRLANGYGHIGRDAKHSCGLAHRLSWEIYRGPIPPGMFVCHKCDNPRCVNPDHLFIGTASDNKGRDRHVAEQPRTRGIRHWNVKLNPEQVAEIRARRGEPRKVLAQEFGTTPRYISALICGTKRKYDGEIR